VALELLERAGDFVSDDIWHRVVQLVTNNGPMQEYAVTNVVEALKRGAAHEVNHHPVMRMQSLGICACSKPCSTSCCASYGLGDF
jgi:hypothetical protein